MDQSLSINGWYNAVDKINSSEHNKFLDDWLQTVRPMY